MENKEKRNFKHYWEIVEKYCNEYFFAITISFVFLFILFLVLSISLKNWNILLTSSTIMMPIFFFASSLSFEYDSSKTLKAINKNVNYLKEVSLGKSVKKNFPKDSKIEKEELEKIVEKPNPIKY